MIFGMSTTRDISKLSQNSLAKKEHLSFVSTPIFVILLFQPHTRALFHYSTLKIFLIPIIVFFFNPKLSLSISFITVITVTVSI